MRIDTRQAYHSYLEQQVRLNGALTANESFTVTPSVQQTLEQKIQESSGFLSRINIVGVDDKQGEKIKLGVSGPIAGRTDVDSEDRATTDVSTLDKDGYNCESTEYDTHIGWNTLDAWAKFPDFQIRLRDQVIKRQRLDRIMVGFNGTSAASSTDIVTNPMLEDVNIGWLQKYRDNAPANVMDEKVASSGVVNVGSGGDYENIDALVFDVVNEMIDPWHRDDTALFAICGRKLLSDKYFPIVNQDFAATPTEKVASDVILSARQIGGLRAMAVPFVPDDTLFITTLDNLSIYWQRGSRRRFIEDNARRKRIEHYDSSNDAYVVEDYGAGCMVENITFV